MKEEFEIKCEVKQMVGGTSIYTKKNSQCTLVSGQLAHPLYICTLTPIELTTSCAIVNLIGVAS